MSDLKLKRPRGRPPAPEKLKRRHNVTFRIRSDLRAKLQDAADQFDRSLSEELERRIELSFDRAEAVRDLIGGLSRFLSAESKTGEVQS